MCERPGRKMDDRSQDEGERGPLGDNPGVRGPIPPAEGKRIGTRTGDAPAYLTAQAKRTERPVNNLVNNVFPRYSARQRRRRRRDWCRRKH